MPPAMKKKILYIFSDTGGGHRSAANAIVKSVECLRPAKYNQEMIDAFAQCSGFLNVFAKLYSPVIKYSPELWGRLYYWLDDQKKLAQLEKLSRPFILKELTRLIAVRKPDLIVSVHPMVNHLTVQAIRDSGLKIPFVVVITDPVTLHRAWIKPEVDLVIVASKEAKQNAINYGMPEKKLKVIGMPIDPKFLLSQKTKAVKTTKFTILLMGGGEGAGKMGEIIKEFDRAKFDGKLIVICGRNKNLEEKLKKQAPGFSFELEVIGFTDQVPEVMGRSNLIITKAGPGTIAEALAKNLPIIITSWLPGQEEGNVEFVVKGKVGKVSRDPKKVVELVRQIRASGEYEAMKRNIKKVSRPDAALEIAKEIFKFL